MIQRIQTLFLLLASGSAFGLFALPFAQTNETVSTSDLFSDGLYTIQDNIGLLSIFAAAGLLSFIAIFMFKKRKNQLLLSRIAIVANIIGLVLAVLLFMQDQETLGNVTPDDGMGLYLPIVFLLFGFLAQRFIQKDEKLVQSMDRLR